MTHPHDLIRVRDKAAGAERTVRRLVADADPKRYDVLNKDALDHQGRPLPAKPVTNHKSSGTKPEGAADQAAATA